MPDALAPIAEMPRHFPAILELRVSSGLVIAGLLALWLWRRQHDGR